MTHRGDHANPGLPRPSRWAIALVALATSAPIVAQDEVKPTNEESFFSWTSPAYQSETTATRRRALAEALAASGGGVFVAPAADGFSGGETFRQADDFHYFVGLELPNAVLLVQATGEAVVYAPRRDKRFENPSRTNDFPGRPLADDPAIGKTARITIRPLEELDSALQEATDSGITLFLNAGSRGGDDAPETDYVRTFTLQESLWLHLDRRFPDAAIVNAYPIIARLRLVKSSEEIDALRRAATVTANSIHAAAARIRPGVTERTLEGILEASYKAGGAQRRAFDSIIKSGPNSLWPWRILAAQYDRRNRVMLDGELVIFDVGCEFDQYSSDMGRTFPVSGSFTPRQRDLVRMVTRISDAVIAAVRPGVTLRDLQKIAVETIPPKERRYMQAGLFFGHHVGLAVGDPNLPEQALAPGMTFTVEPWYYNHDEEIAVFIEDEVLVTEAGAENLTASLPRTTSALESMVLSGRSLDKGQDSRGSVVQLASGLGFTEGPVWLPEEQTLVFSDIPASKLMRWSERQGLAVYRESENANGNLLDHEGRLLSCQHGGRNIVRQELDGSLQVIADRFQGQRFNSPNDLAIQSDGTIWFTDPPWGLKNLTEGKEQAGHFVFRRAGDGQIAKVLDQHLMPNGIALSPDEQTLYVADTGGHPLLPDPSSHDAPPILTAYAIVDGELLSEPRWQVETLCDGMCIDVRGNIYATGSTGVSVWSPGGDSIGFIEVPEHPANVCFGGEDYRTLFITARTSLYSVALGVAGHRVNTTAKRDRR